MARTAPRCREMVARPGCLEHLRWGGRMEDYGTCGSRRTGAIRDTGALEVKLDRGTLIYRGRTSAQPMETTCPYRRWQLA